MHALLRFMLMCSILVVVALGLSACGDGSGGGGASNGAGDGASTKDASTPASTSKDGVETIATTAGEPAKGDCSARSKAVELKAGAKVRERLLAAAQFWLSTTDDPSFAGAKITGGGDAIAGCAKGISYAYVMQFNAPTNTCAVDLQGWFTKEPGGEWITQRLVCAGDIGGICANTPKPMRKLWYPDDQGMAAGCGWKR